MKRLLALPLIAFAASISGQATPCATSPLSTYIHSGTLYSCSEADVTITFNNTALPSYVGLNLLSSNNHSADPNFITTTPGDPGLYFSSSAFTQTSGILPNTVSSQSELVHFSVFSAGTTISSTTFSLSNMQTSAGSLPLVGAGLAIGQELVCIGGTFTSLPVGLVTTVANGVLGAGTYGCTGAVVVGTAGVKSGVLGNLTELLSLPSLSGLTDNAVLDLGSFNVHQIDVIKILGLVAVAGGSASVSGFGDSFALAPVAAPEPGPAALLAGGLALLAIARRRRA